VVTTPAGRDLAERLREGVFTALAPFTDRLGADDRQVLTRLLDAVSETSTVDNRSG
jgi:hypothetical protein